MKRILALVTFLMFSSVPIFAAHNSQKFLLPSDVRVGSSHLAQGHYEVTWTEAAGSEVELTFKGLDSNPSKAITVRAKKVDATQSRVGVVTSVVNGVTLLQELHTAKARFILVDDHAGE